MGATAAVELRKPSDASDILATNDLAFAKAEIIRLRGELGHLAKSYGMEVVCLDATDIVLGDDESADFQRCVKEISHIRRCLHLSTLSSKRESRGGNYVTPRRNVRDPEETKEDSRVDSDSDSSSD